ncbi:uncharacterized protein L203_105548 [Cryptococcus depauperatus CBS 7841]|uniref:RING-type domain-containing protein n=1 Tax=Cryptococcus depauperatus CBS 7841 TaxID=1295531 RepID=A0AAJ8JXQ6_9TREE
MSQQLPGSPTGSPQRSSSSRPVFAMTIAMSGPPPRQGRQEQGDAETNQEQPAETTLFWTIQIGPGSVPGAASPQGDQPQDSNADQDVEPGARRDVGSGGNGTPLPRLFPPFFHFFMPRGEPQPNTEKAAELLRSLPTVGKNLLQRVNKVVAAQDVDSYEDEDERGWKCGICLEGIPKIEVTEDKVIQIDGQGDEAKVGTGVKALPCNHLFHGGCLEPWFATHHTCPTCRLDLDPLQTLNSPRHPTHNNTLRPGRTGSGRPSPDPHPYNQNRTLENEQGRTESNQTRLLEGLFDNETSAFDDPPAPSSGGNSGQRLRLRQQRSTPHFLIFTGPPFPHVNGRGREDGHRSQVPSANAGTEESAEPEAAVGANASSIPGFRVGNTQPGRETLDNATNSSDAQLNFIFGGPTSASPLSMERQSTPAPESTNLSTSTLAPAVDDNISQYAGSQTEPQNPHNPQSEARSGSERPQAERRPHIDFFREALERIPFFLAQNHHNLFPTVSPFPNENGDRLGTPATNGDDEIQVDASMELREDASVNGGIEGQDTPQTRRREPHKATFVSQSLESWTEEREKSLGWRCDAPECIYGPPTGEDGDIVMDSPLAVDEDQRDKEIISIFSALQPPLSPAAAQKAQQDKHLFTILACPHRWHRGCLESAERTAGRMGRDDGDGRVWARCERCRKDGWIVSRVEEPSGSRVGQEKKVADMAF